MGLVWDATGDEHLFQFVSALLVNSFADVQNAGSPCCPASLGWASSEPGLCPCV